MALKCQKWRLIFRKFHEIPLALKMPKCGIFITTLLLLYFFLFIYLFIYFFLNVDSP